jgi:hypothetical protein
MIGVAGAAMQKDAVRIAEQFDPQTIAAFDALVQASKIATLPHPAGRDRRVVIAAEAHEVTPKPPALEPDVPARGMSMGKLRRLLPHADRSLPDLPPLSRGRGALTLAG